MQSMGLEQRVYERRRKLRPDGGEPEHQQEQDRDAEPDAAVGDTHPYDIAQQARTPVQKPQRLHSQSSPNSMRQSCVSMQGGWSAFSRTKSSRTKMSMPVRMKHRYASSGVHTMGSLRTLKLVLTRIP